MMRHLSFLLAGCVIALAACTPPVAGNPPAAQDTPAAPQPTATPSPQAGAGPDAYRGAAVAGQVCSRCHDVGQGAPPAVNIGAPAFQAIANSGGATAEGLAEWMGARHPAMPNFLFTGPEVPDVAAYIMSLKGPA